MRSKRSSGTHSTRTLSNPTTDRRTRGQAMSAPRDEQQAVHEYGQFIDRLSASRAENAQPGMPDRPPVSAELVSRADMLKAFLDRNPDYERFRDRLDKVQSV